MTYVVTPLRLNAQKQTYVEFADLSLVGTAETLEQAIEASKAYVDTNVHCGIELMNKDTYELTEHKF
jgi:hypothetical protein